MTAFLLSPARNLIRVGLALVGFAMALLAVVAATLVVPVHPAFRAMRALSDLGRRLSGRWGGVAISTPSPPIAVEPEYRDGWYVYNNQLFKSRAFPAAMLRIESLSDDTRLTRDWMWLFLTPFVGALGSALAVGLIAGGVAVAVVGDPTAVRLAGVLMVALGVAIGPAALRAHGLWDRELLQPPEDSWWHRSGIAGWIARTSRAAWGGAGLAGLSIASFALGVVAGAVILVTWGGAAGPALHAIRPWMRRYRRHATKWTGIDLPDPYRPMPPIPAAGPDGRYRLGRTLFDTREAAIRGQRDTWVRQDPASWRELAWMLTGPPLAVVSLIPAVLIGVGFFGLVWQVLWWWPWAVPIGLTTGVWITPWYMWLGVAALVPAAAAIPSWVSLPIGFAIAGVGSVLARPIVRLRERVDRWLLAPTRATALAERVDRLTETRADAVDAQAAELRRIERDLHDGAQARLVAVGLGLATVEQLWETDPAAARELLAQTRESSVTALNELRNLVRGIHPPVLAERGLGDAVRAVALDQVVPIEVSVNLPGRFAAPVESAAYFAVCEALANAARHAAATAVDIDLAYADGRLVIQVRDNGRGGADPALGSGLVGLRKRLGTFDGTLVVDSPPGGPTLLRMELPCAPL